MRKILPVLLLLQTFVYPQTITEKLATTRQSSGYEMSLDDFLHHVNERLYELQHELMDVYASAMDLDEEEGYIERVAEIAAIKKEIAKLETQWREAAKTDAKAAEEGYGLWDTEETTLDRLVMEYGSSDYLYVVPAEIGALKISLHSTLPIPRESWSEMLELILAQNGIGIKELNPYARQLYLLKKEPTLIEAIASSRADLALVQDGKRVFYLLSPPIEEVSSTLQFFDKFSDKKQTFIQQIGQKIAIVAPKSEVEKLLNLFDTVWESHGGKISKVVLLSRVSVSEMEKLLKAFFTDSLSWRPPFSKGKQQGLKIIPLTEMNALSLIGREEIVQRAERLIEETERQFLDPCEMTIYLYHCLHSDPNDLSAMLERVYASLLMTSGEDEGELMDLTIISEQPIKGIPPLVVSPPPFGLKSSSRIEVDQKKDHFIADAKSGTILMVVRRDALKKIQDLLKRVDVPKKMVQIEVLLFEKKLSQENSFGMNLLKLGSVTNHIGYSSLHAPGGKGVLEFLFGSKKHGIIPVFDLAYTFLLTQEDIQLNAAPSVMTVNQTPATISLVEEISINNGAAVVDTSKGTGYEKSFSRVQYGITISITPTIHQSEADEEGFITLETNITFDTTKPNANERPLVNRRHIENEVRIRDGQTVIIGGLRRKSLEDVEEKIPFLGDLPGIGKLFGTTKLTDTNTEMFIFITPTIIKDSREEWEKIKRKELQKRVGDTPEFLERLQEAEEKEAKRYFNCYIDDFLTRKKR